jgi:hypothetical protein
MSFKTHLGHINLFFKYLNAISSLKFNFFAAVVITAACVVVAVAVEAF